MHKDFRKHRNESKDSGKLLHKEFGMHKDGRVKIQINFCNRKLDNIRMKELSDGLIYALKKMVKIGLKGSSKKQPL